MSYSFCKTLIGSVIPSISKQDNKTKCIEVITINALLLTAYATFMTLIPIHNFLLYIQEPSLKFLRHVCRYSDIKYPIRKYQ